MRAKTEIIRLATLRVPRPSPFGEFLVQQRVLDRYQLFRVLQQQDRVPDAKLGACAVALGYVQQQVVEDLYRRFCADSDTQDFDTMITEAFHPEPELEVIYGSQDIELDFDA